MAKRHLCIVQSLAHVFVLFTTLCMLLQLTGAQTPGRCRDSADSFSHECYSDLCFVHHYRDTSSNEISNKTIDGFHCFHKDINPHWRDFCDGLEDDEDNVYQCCQGDLCNVNLRPLLPSEPIPDGPTGIPPYRPNADPDSQNTTGENLIDCKFQIDNLVTGHPGYCYGHICYTVRLINNSHQLTMQYGCYNKVLHPDWTDYCDGAKNTNHTTYVCCEEGGRCNENLQPRLPSELVSPTPEPEPETEPETDPPTPPEEDHSVYTWLAILFGIMTLGLILSLVITVVTVVTCLHTRKRRSKTIIANTNTVSIQNKSCLRQDNTHSQVLG